MSKIEREKRIVQQMIALHCHQRHHTAPGTLCPECSELLAYAQKRLDRCPFGQNKSTCQHCTIHCYTPEMRSKIRQVMRYVGPRMLLHHPLSTIRHLLNK